MSFAEDLERQLAESKSRDVQQAETAQRRLQAGLDALDRLQSKTSDAAAFLASRHVPTEPFVNEHLRQTFWSGSKKVPETLDRGWKLQWYSLAISEGGQLWQSAFVEQQGVRLLRAAPFDFEGIRESLAGEQKVIVPLGGYRLVFPSISWTELHGFQASAREAVQIRYDHSDSSDDDLEAAIAKGVVELVKQHS